MSQAASSQILAAVRERFECWNNGEIDLMLNEYAPDATVDLTRVLPDESVLHGHEAFDPFEKPVPLLRTLIAQSTQPGELVVDPFCGSGNTGRAARARPTSTAMRRRRG